MLQLSRARRKKAEPTDERASREPKVQVDDPKGKARLVRTIPREKEEDRRSIARSRLRETTFNLLDYPKS